jgi:FHA domain/von Willebrand factor type A domain
VTGYPSVRYMCATLLAVALCLVSLAALANQDVVLLLANSSNMRANASAVTQAAIDFVDSRGPDTRIAVLAYTNKQTVEMPLSPINYASRQRAGDILQHLDFRGPVPDITAGLQQALAEIIDHGDVNTQKSIVLITNDVANSETATVNKENFNWIMQSLMPTAVYNHVRIYGITFVAGNVYKNLQVLTLGTGGQAFQIAHDSELSGIFQQISASMLNGGSASMLVSPGQIMLPAGAAKPPISSQFNTPLTHRNLQSLRTRWLWLIGFLVVLAASIGIYAAWNIMRHIRVPKKIERPLTLYGEGPRAVLYDISNPNDIKRHELAERSTLLGRVAGYDPEVQYVLVKEKTVGRCHAVIERRGHSFWIMDQGSINGTFVNGERITADRALKHGDIVAIHRHEFEFMIPEYFESESTVVGAREQLAG